MPFSSLIGNSAAKAACARMVEQKSVPNTLLFYGPDGVGKSLFARSLAELLMGPESAFKIRSGNHPDLHFLEPEGKSSTHPIENIRKLISEVALPPFEAPVKVFIIADAHQMLPTSSNALLKTFEEPTAHSYFILLTNSLEAMLPTIVSRCRKISFFPIPQAEVETLIKTQWEKTPEEARRIAFLAQGSLAKAEQLCASRHLPWREPLLDMLTLHLPQDYPQFLKLAAKIEEECQVEKEEEEEASSLSKQAEPLLEEIALWYRDLHLLKEKIAPEYLYHLDSLDRLQGVLSQPLLPMEKILDKLSLSRLALQRSIKLRHVLEQFFLGSH